MKNGYKKVMWSISYDLQAFIRKAKAAWFCAQANRMVWRKTSRLAALAVAIEIKSRTGSANWALKKLVPLQMIRQLFSPSEQKVDAAYRRAAALGHAEASFIFGTRLIRYPPGMSEAAEGRARIYTAAEMGSISALLYLARRCGNTDAAMYYQAAAWHGSPAGIASINDFDKLADVKTIRDIKRRARDFMDINAGIKRRAWENLDCTS